jgi:hypothetical protein
MFAFNVGQANFVVMRKGKEIVIVETGTGWGEEAEYLLEPIRSVLQDTILWVYLSLNHTATTLIYFYSDIYV